MSSEVQRHAFDDHRVVVRPGGSAETLKYCVEQWLSIGELAIAERGVFCVALSGGSTPKAIFQLLSSEEYRGRLDWARVLFFWGDERAVPLDHGDSNYRMAMTAGLGTLPGVETGVNVFPMETVGALAEEPAEHGRLAAERYQALLLEKVPGGRGQLDLVMLGVGEDGHTASLFPHTKALRPADSSALVLFNEVPQLSTWRMTLTYEAINRARHAIFYVLGSAKAPIIEKLFSKGPVDLDQFPSQAVGTPANPAQWMLDFDAKL